MAIFQVCAQMEASARRLTSCALTAAHRRASPCSCRARRATVRREAPWQRTTCVTAFFLDDGLVVGLAWCSGGLGFARMEIVRVGRRQADERMEWLTRSGLSLSLCLFLGGSSNGPVEAVRANVRAAGTHRAGEQAHGAGAAGARAETVHHVAAICMAAPVARGLRDAGAHTAAQYEARCAVFGMPLRPSSRAPRTKWCPWAALPRGCGRRQRGRCGGRDWAGNDFPN